MTLSFEERKVRRIDVALKVLQQQKKNREEKKRKKNSHSHSSSLIRRSCFPSPAHTPILRCENC